MGPGSNRRWSLRLKLKECSMDSKRRATRDGKLTERGQKKRRRNKRGAAQTKSHSSSGKLEGVHGHRWRVMQGCHGGQSEFLIKRDGEKAVWIPEETLRHLLDGNMMRAIAAHGRSSAPPPWHTSAGLYKREDMFRGLNGHKVG